MSKKMKSKNFSNLKIYDFNLETINKYLKYPINTPKLKDHSLNKIIKNELITNKLLNLKEKQSKKLQRQNLYFEKVNYLTLNPKLQIKINFLRNQLQNKLFVFQTQLNIPQNSFYTFLKKDKLSKNRSRVFKYMSLFKLIFNQFKNLEKLNKLSLKSKNILLFYKKKSLKRKIKKKIINLYLPFILKDNVFKYHIFGFDKLELRNKNILKKLNLFNNNFYPSFIDQNINKLNYSSQELKDNLQKYKKLNTDYLFNEDILDLLYFKKSYEINLPLIQKKNNTKELNKNNFFIKKKLFKILKIF